MSRGLGRLERAIIDHIDDPERGAERGGGWVFPYPVGLYSLQAVVFGGPPTTAERKSLERAIRTLQDKGALIDTGYKNPDSFGSGPYARHRLVREFTTEDAQDAQDAKQRQGPLERGPSQREPPGQRA